MRKISNLIIVPLQFAGIGDCIFTQTLVKRLAEQHGAKGIMWPVLPQFVDGLQRAYPTVQWVDMMRYAWINFESRIQQTIYRDGTTYLMLPIRFADSIMRVPYTECMKSKYMMYDMDWQDWKENAMWNRSHVREMALWDIVWPDDEGSTALVNNTFRSDFSGNVEIYLPADTQQIKMQQVDHFSIFDWAKVIENVDEIHTVSTSILYLLELLEIPCTTIYPRRPDEQDFKNVDYIFSKPYHLCIK